MNRRNFLKALLGAAAAPVVAQIADPFKGPAFLDPVETAWVENAGEWTVIDLRAAALAQLARWYADVLDKAIFDALGIPSAYS